MTIQQISMKWKGISPLIMHSGSLADPLSNHAKASKKISSKRNKTDADHEEMARIEFIGSLYMDENGPCIPADNIEAALIDGAKKLRRGTDAKAGMYCMKHASIQYKGPRTADELWKTESFRNRVGVRIQKSRIMRTRPIFNIWECEVHLEFEDSMINQSDVIEFARRAGSIVGVCDWRPKYGRFEVL